MNKKKPFIVEFDGKLEIVLATSRQDIIDKCWENLEGTVDDYDSCDFPKTLSIMEWEPRQYEFRFQPKIVTVQL